MYSEEKLEKLVLKKLSKFQKTSNNNELKISKTIYIKAVLYNMENRKPTVIKTKKFTTGYYTQLLAKINIKSDIELLQKFDKELADRNIKKGNKNSLVNLYIKMLKDKNVFAFNVCDICKDILYRNEDDLTKYVLALTYNDVKAKATKKFKHLHLYDPI